MILKNIDHLDQCSLYCMIQLVGQPLLDWLSRRTYKGTRSEPVHKWRIGVKPVCVLFVNKFPVAAKILERQPVMVQYGRYEDFVMASPAFAGCVL